jgi:hypothetical protein
MISPKKQLTLVRIPQSKGENSIEAADAILAPLFVRMDNDLCVRARFELMSSLLEFLAQLDKVVDLTVENNLEASVFVTNGLGTSFHIDDAESAVPEADFAINKLTLSIRTSVPYDGGHGSQEMPVNHTA